MHAHYNTCELIKENGVTSSLSSNYEDSGDSNTGSVHKDTTQRKVSDVWKYFNKSADKKKAVCSICDKALSYSLGPTNLRDHLQAKHPLQYFTTTKPTIKCTTLDDFVRHILSAAKLVQRPL